MSSSLISTTTVARSIQSPAVRVVAVMDPLITVPQSVLVIAARDAAEIERLRRENKELRMMNQYFREQLVAARRSEDYFHAQYECANEKSEREAISHEVYTKENARLTAELARKTRELVATEDKCRRQKETGRRQLSTIVANKKELAEKNEALDKTKAELAQANGKLTTKKPLEKVQRTRRKSLCVSWGSSGSEETCVGSIRSEESGGSSISNSSTEMEAEKEKK